MKNSLSQAPGIARLVMAALVIAIFFERPLKAYADPGSGLLMWQLTGAVVLGVIFQVRRIARKLRDLVFDHQQQKNTAR